MTITQTQLKLKALRMIQRVLTAGDPEAPPVIMLHGNPDNADEWRGVMSRLSADFYCLAPDLPGYGRSMKLPRSFRYTVSDQLRFLDVFLDAADVRGKVILAVHDVGAIMGIPWAAQNLDRVHAVLITNTVAFEGFQWFRTARQWGARDIPGRLLASLMMWAIGLRSGARFRSIFGNQNPQLSEQDLVRIVETFALNPAAKAACLRQFRAMMKSNFFDGFDAANAKIANVVPVEVIWGDEDPYVATEYAHHFATDRVRILPGVGHWTPIIAPEEVSGGIRSLWKSK